MVRVQGLTCVPSTIRKHKLGSQSVLPYLLIALAGVTHAAGKKHAEKEFLFERYGFPPLLFLNTYIK